MFFCYVYNLEQDVTCLHLYFTNSKSSKNVFVLNKYNSINWLPILKSLKIGFIFSFQDVGYVQGASVDNMCHNSSKVLAEADGGASKYGDFK